MDVVPGPERPVTLVGHPGDRRGHTAGPVAGRAARRGELLPCRGGVGSRRPGHPGLRHQERVRRGRVGPVGRRRLVAGRRHRRRRPRGRQGPRRPHAVPLLERPLGDRRRPAGRRRSASRPGPSPSRPAHAGMSTMLAESFEGRDPDLTEENLQSRIRGMVLMALSNKFGWLVLTTSNKSESAVGYATLYGDTAGGFAVIKDVPKLLVYDLAALPQRRRRPRADPRGRPDQAPVGRAASRPARRPEPPALRRAGPDPRGSTSRTTVPSRRSSAAGHDPGRRWRGSSASSTGPSTSAG